MHWSNPLYDICIGVIHCIIYPLDAKIKDILQECTKGTRREHLSQNGYGTIMRQYARYNDGYYDRCSDSCRNSICNRWVPEPTGYFPHSNSIIDVAIDAGFRLVTGGFRNPPFTFPTVIAL